MGKINIGGGSPLTMNFEYMVPGKGLQKSPGDFTVKLVQNGDVYYLERTDGVRFQTAKGNAANMTATNPGGTNQRIVIVDFAN